MIYLATGVAALNLAFGLFVLVTDGIFSLGWINLAIAVWLGAIVNRERRFL